MFNLQQHILTQHTSHNGRIILPFFKSFKFISNFNRFKLTFPAFYFGRQLEPPQTRYYNTGENNTDHFNNNNTLLLNAHTFKGQPQTIRIPFRKSNTHRILGKTIRNFSLGKLPTTWPTRRKISKTSQRSASHISTPGTHTHTFTPGDRFDREKAVVTSHHHTRHVPIQIRCDCDLGVRHFSDGFALSRLHVRRRPFTPTYLFTRK